MARVNRSENFDPLEVTDLHCIQRAVRRAMLCGRDPVSGKSFEHRRTWVQDRLQELAGRFGMDCLGFAILARTPEESRYTSVRERIRSEREP